MTESDPDFDGLRVLIVEDELMVAMMLEDMLADLRCTALGPARTVQMALDAVAVDSPQAAILDMNLRGERADPIADELLKRGIPFVFSTGYGRAGIDERFSDIPVLQKPFEMRDLAKALVAIRPPAA